MSPTRPPPLSRANPSAAGAASIVKPGKHRSKTDSEGIAVPAADMPGNESAKTKAEIVAAASIEFSLHGYSGTRIDQICSRARISKPTIYYYFASKEELFKAALSDHYRRLSQDEEHLHLEQRPPLEAMRELTRFTLAWYMKSSGEVPLIMDENIHHGRHIASLRDMSVLNSNRLKLVESIYRKGRAEGVMRPGLRAVDIYFMIASASFFAISNRYTFEALFGHDMCAPREIERRRTAVIEAVVRYVAVDGVRVSAPAGRSDDPEFNRSRADVRRRR